MKQSFWKNSGKTKSLYVLDLSLSLWMQSVVIRGTTWRFALSPPSLTFEADPQQPTYNKKKNDTKIKNKVKLKTLQYITKEKEIK